MRSLKLSSTGFLRLQQGLLPRLLPRLLLQVHLLQKQHRQQPLQAVLSKRQCRQGCLRTRPQRQQPQQAQLQRVVHQHISSGRLGRLLRLHTSKLSIKTCLMRRQWQRQKQQQMQWELGYLFPMQYVQETLQLELSPMLFVVGLVPKVQRLLPRLKVGLQMEQFPKHLHGTTLVRHLMHTRQQKERDFLGMPHQLQQMRLLLRWKVVFYQNKPRKLVQKLQLLST
jgi:hypothetical protein